MPTLKTRVTTQKGGATAHVGGATAHVGVAAALTRWLAVMELFEMDQIGSCAPAQRETRTFLFEKRKRAA